MDYLIIIILIIFSALFSGLTIGFLGLNKTELERKATLKNKKAIKIITIRRDANFLLVVLLLGNVLINSILSIFLANLLSGVMAVIISTSLIVVFGEILPQAIFYRHALSIGYHFVPVVKFFQVIFYPIAKPIAKILDKFLGDEEETIWSKKEIKEIIKNHEDSSRSEIDIDEENIILGALSFSDKKVKQVMTPKSVVFNIEENRILDIGTISEIKKNGFSRIPVFRENEDDIVGVLNFKSLIGVGDGKRVYDIYSRNKLFEVSEEEKLDTILNKFIKKKIHIASVKNLHGTFLGIITMEDIIEEILSTEIVDETDNFIDMRKESMKQNKKSNIFK
jgi:metal transporter CNNM